MPIERLLDIVAELRGENGCPWDREQTLESLKQHLVEECYELIEAIDSGDANKHREELGDILLQVALQARMRQEQGAFCFDDVVETLCAKLVRRHPHVFGKTRVSGSAEVLRNWEAIKAAEKSAAGVPGSSSVANVPRHMPALRKAHQVLARAERFGHGRAGSRDAARQAKDALAALARLAGKRDEAVLKEKLGDVLFALVSLGRARGVNAEDALNASTNRFIRGFGAPKKKKARLERTGIRPRVKR